MLCQPVIQSFRSAGVALAGSFDECKRAKSLIHHLARALPGHGWVVADSEITPLNLNWRIIVNATP